MSEQPALPPRHVRLTRALLLGPVFGVAIGLLAGGPTRSAMADAGAVAAGRIEAGRAFAWLDELQTRYPGRQRGSVAHREAPAFIASALVAAGAVDVRLERLAALANGDAVNVLGRVPGVDARQRVVLAAHHDVVAGAPGAIDDGGAIAAIFEAVRALAAGPPPACDVEVAIFDLEELGLVGSRAHLRALTKADPDARARVRAALAVELVGWRKDALVVHTIPWGFATRAEGVPPAWVPVAVRAAARDAGVTVGLGDPLVSPWYQATVRVLGLNTGSDADAYLSAGVPACLLTGSSLTNFYDAYHRPADDMSQVEPARLDDAARAIAAAAHELAGLPPDVVAHRRLGDAYVVLGLRTLGHGWLALVGLLCAAPLVVTALGLREARWRVAAALAAATAIAVAVVASIASPFGLSILGPLALGVAAAASFRRVRPGLYAGLVLALLEPMLIAAGAGSFGFRWQGGPVETWVTSAGAVAACALGSVLLRGAVRPAAAEIAPLGPQG